jgi:hypothetical protein
LELLCVGAVLKSQHSIVGVSDHDYFTCRRERHSHPAP